MAIETLLGVWVPAVVIAHVLALVTLLYSLEKSFGLISKALRKLLPKPAVQDVPAKEYAAADEEDEHVEEEARIQRPRWVRGVEDKDGNGRWVPPGTQSDVEGSGKVIIPAVEADLLVAIPADLSWNALACWVKDPKTLLKKQILQPSCGVVVPGEMVALVGPSGAGKSTLLDILAQRKSAGNLTGQVWMNGKPLGQKFKRISAYVSQEDVFVPTMSAWETLLFHARLRTGKELTRAELEKRMQEVLTVMGLWRSKDTVVGGVLPGGVSVRGLSGGEKRRLTVSCSLIARPSILFMDEPTTGLDSFAALNIMDHMANLAHLGHTIIASIHQPRTAIWEMFHKVVVLSEGNQVYMGPPDKAVEWFSLKLGYSYQPVRDGAVSDWLMDLVSVGFQKPASYAARSMTTRTDVERAAKAFRERKVKDEDSAIIAEMAAESKLQEKEEEKGGEKRKLSLLKGRYAAGWWTQFQVLLHRAFVAQLRNPTDVTSRLLLSVWVGILAGLVFINVGNGPAASFQRLAILFFVMLLFELLPFCYMSFYVADRKFYAADVAAGLYHSSAYYIAQILAGFPFVVINTVLGSYAAYGLVGLRYQARAIVGFGGIMLLQSLIAIQLMIFSVYVTPNQDLAYVLATGYVAVSILLGGFYIRIGEIKLIPLKWLSNLSYPLFTMQGLAHLELQGIRYRPAGCIASGMPGATDDELRVIMRNNTLALEAQKAGLVCYPVSNGERILRYWDFSMPVEQVAGILIAFYVVFHVLSYLALANMYKAKR